MRVFKPSPPEGGGAALILNECGEDMSIAIGGIGFVRYERKDAEHLAKRLDDAARMVREHS